MKKKSFRIPKDMADALRHKGGAHTTEKGNKGYNRRKQRRDWRKQADLY